MSNDWFMAAWRPVSRMRCNPRSVSTTGPISPAVLSPAAAVASSAPHACESSSDVWNPRSPPDALVPESSERLRASSSNAAPAAVGSFPLISARSFTASDFTRPR